MKVFDARSASAVVSILALAFTGGARAEEGGESKSAAEALEKGKVSVRLRYRFEDVSDDAQPKDARASTLRTALSFRTGSLWGFSGEVEFEDVTDLGFDDQHDNGGAGSLSNGVTDRPVILDPDDTEIQQANLRYTGFPDTAVTVGRQEFGLGEQRFVGPVGWRQNHQSFDALRVTNAAVPRTTLDYAYLRNVNRINGENKDMGSHLFHGEIEIAGAGSLTPYVYILDYEETADASLSTSTYGARWRGKWRRERGWSFPYHVELARQRDAGDNPSSVDAGYLRVEVRGERESLTLTAGYEVLGGSFTEGRFTTPLATLHKWNGWADKFGVTPPDGLRDLYLAAGARRGRLSGTLVYHDFRSDVSGTDYGSEIDAVAVYRAPWDQTFSVKLATYDADGFSTDTTKVMIYTEYAF